MAAAAARSVLLSSSFSFAWAASITSDAVFSSLVRPAAAFCRACLPTSAPPDLFLGSGPDDYRDLTEHEVGYTMYSGQVGVGESSLRYLSMFLLLATYGRGVEE